LLYGYSWRLDVLVLRALVAARTDILQSVPILLVLPVVLLAPSLFCCSVWRGEVMAAIILIFTSQAWNLTFSSLPVDDDNSN